VRDFRQPTFQTGAAVNPAGDGGHRRSRVRAERGPEGFQQEIGAQKRAVHVEDERHGLVAARTTPGAHLVVVLVTARRWRIRMLPHLPCSSHRRVASRPVFLPRADPGAGKFIGFRPVPQGNDQFPAQRHACGRFDFDQSLRPSYHVRARSIEMRTSPVWREYGVRRQEQKTQVESRK
jgi:hypothetical protein